MVAVQANRKYVVIREGYENTGLYILNTATSELQEIDYSVHAGMSIFILYSICAIYYTYYNKFGQESQAASPAFFPSHA